MTDIPYLFSAKAAADRRSYGFDFGSQPEFHRPAQTIIAMTVTLAHDAPDTNLTIETPVLSGRPATIVSAYISQGTAGVVYPITYQVHTDQGVVLARTILLPVEEG